MEEKKITFEDIQRVNAEMTYKTLKNDKTGKVIGDYIEVNQRIQAFRKLFPTGIIETEMLSNEDGVCIFRAVIGYREGGELYKLATGTAYEKENSTFINKTSYIENCETSAVGRALGMLALGIDTSIASAEEMENAIINQEPQEERKATEGQLNVLDKLSDTDKEKVYTKYSVKTMADLTITQASEIIGLLKKGNK